MKNVFKKVGKSALALSILANTFAPLAVTADVTPVPATLTFTVTNTAKYKITKNDHDDPFELVVTDKTDTNSETNNSRIRIKSGNTEIQSGITATCTTENVTCKFEIESVGEYSIDYNPGFIDISEGTSKIDDKAKFVGNKDFSISQATMGSNFDGHAVLVWSCGESEAKVCYHEYTNLNQEGHDVIFESAANIADDHDSSKKFNVDAKVKFFSPWESFETKKTEIDNQAITPIDPESLVGPDGIDYMPVGEPTENNAFVSYGNRNFKAIIYGDKYKALKIGDLSTLTYYPAAWENKLTRRESFDISGTTRDNPVEFDMVLLESKINLQKIDLNGFTIKSIEALDVPEGAVTITKKNDGSYDFDFASRFFNKVVFKLTDEDNKEYFFRINRQAMAIKVDGNKEHNWTITSELYFDRNTSWEDYSVNARILYKDGSSKIVKLYNAKHIDDGLGNSAEVYENDEQNPVRPEWPKGKGLKRAVFKTKIDNSEMLNVDKIYLNVEMNGSTDSTYAGNYAGSGKGEVIDMTKEEYQRRMK